MPMSHTLLVPRQSFSPLKVPGCICDLDASRLSSLFQSSDGTTPATATNDPVGYVGDSSGLGNHGRQTVATGSRPLLSLNNQNGRPGFVFDGTNDFLTATIAGLQSLTGWTVIQVFKTAAAAAANASTVTNWCFGNASSASGPYPANMCVALSSSTSALAGETLSAVIEPPANGRIGSSTYARALNAAQCLAFAGGTGGTQIHSNGSAVTMGLASVATTSSPSSPSATGYTVDNDLHIGAVRAGGSLFYTPAMTLHQHLVYNRVLASGELGYLWNGLRAKWGIT